MSVAFDYMVLPLAHPKVIPVGVSWYSEYSIKNDWSLRYIVNHHIVMDPLMGTGQKALIDTGQGVYCIVCMLLVREDMGQCWLYP